MRKSAVTEYPCSSLIFIMPPYKTKFPSHHRQYGTRALMFSLDIFYQEIDTFECLLVLRLPIKIVFQASSNHIFLIRPQPLLVDVPSLFLYSEQQFLSGGVLYCFQNKNCQQKLHHSSDRSSEFLKQRNFLGLHHS